MIIWCKHNLTRWSFGAETTRFFTLDGVSAIQALLPDAEVNLYDAGHFALETHAAEIGDEILDVMAPPPSQRNNEMTKILHIIAPPRGDASQPSKLADAYLAERKAIDPAVDIDVLDLWRANLPEFNGDKAAAKITFFGVGELNRSSQTAWDQVMAITERFSAADEHVLSVPMWNCGVLYKLKQYIDIIIQPGLLFGFDPEAGHSGLLENKVARVFYSAGVYAPGAPEKYGADYHSTYLSWGLDFIGVSEVKASLRVGYSESR